MERDELDIESLLELLLVGDFEEAWPLVAQRIEPVLPQMKVPRGKAAEIAKYIVRKTRATPLCRQVKPTRRGGFDQLKVIFGQILREGIREYSPKWEGHKESEHELSWAELLERDEKLRDVLPFSQLGKLEEEAEGEEEEGGDFFVDNVGEDDTELTLTLGTTVQADEETVSILSPSDEYEGDDDDSDERKTQKDIEDILRDIYKQSIERLSIHIERLRSDQERDIMNSFLCGKKVKEIAVSLSVSPPYVSKVIHKHLKRFGYSENQIKELKLDIKEYT